MDLQQDGFGSAELNFLNPLIKKSLCLTDRGSFGGVVHGQAAAGQEPAPECHPELVQPGPGHARQFCRQSPAGRQLLGHRSGRAKQQGQLMLGCRLKIILFISNFGDNL